MENIKEWLFKRQLVYSILALFYRGELTKGLDNLYNTDFLQQLLDYSDNTILKSSTIKIINDIKDNKNNRDYIKLLLNDYQKLFVGPDHILAPLWESVYRTKDKIIFDETELEIRRLYNKSGLDVKKTEPADHLSLELAFMARLCAVVSVNKAFKINELLVKQLEFLKEHLLKWTLSFVENVKENSSTEFWINWSLITRSWLENDFGELEYKFDIDFYKA